MKSLFSNKHLRYGGMSALILLVFLAVLVLLNWSASLVGNRMNLRWDLTADSIYGLTQETRSFLQNVNKPVRIYVLNSESAFQDTNDYYRQANEQIKLYGKESSNITISYVDLAQDPTFESRYSDLKLAANDVLLESGENTKLLGPLDLFNVSQSYYGLTINSSKVEQAVTSAILTLTSDVTTKVSILTGHDEDTDSLTGLTELLESNNYEVQTQSLVTEEIDPAAKIAIIAAPNHDYDETMLQKLDRYLKQGGALCYFACVTQPELPSLEGYLMEHGLQLESGAVFESDSRRIYSYNPYYVAVNYTDSDFAGGLEQGNRLCLTLNARPMTVIWDTGHEMTALLDFSDTCGIAPLNAPEGWKPTQEDLRANMTAMALSTDSDGGKIVACSSIWFAHKDLLTGTSFSNGQYLLNVFSRLAELEQTVSILPVTIGGETLNMQTSQVTLTGILFMGVVPLLLIVSGLVIWIRRKRR